MARPARSGLPRPRVAESSLQQWIDIVSQRLGGLVGEIDSMARAVSGVQGDIALVTEPGPSTCLLAPTPEGLEAFGGIGIVMVTWANPLRACSNHASATIYRHTADDFAGAAMVGQSEWISFVDDSVEDDTTYFYWVTWTLTNASVSQPSDSVEVETGIDPERFYMELLEDVDADPFTQEILGDINLPQVIAAEIRRLSAQRTLILADLTGLLSRTQNAQQLEIASLEARLTGTMLGPVQNAFTGADRAAAEAARDVYATANPMWLADYDADEDINIQLRYGVVFLYQRRVSNAWVDNGAEQAQASAVTMLAVQVSDLGGQVMAFTASISTLQAAIAGKADTSVVEAVEANVTANGTAIEAVNAAIINLMAAVDGKADVSALEAVSTRVTTNADGIAADGQAITALQSAVSNVGLGPETNEFTAASQAGTESVRDAYAVANPAWLAQYAADPTIAIQLTWE